VTVWLVLVTWPAEGSCWECEGPTGVDWNIVQAHTPGEALTTAAASLHLEAFDETRTLYAFPLRESRGRAARLLTHSDFALLPESAGHLVVFAPDCPCEAPE
jgi:hypothetical protein